ncbi:DUF3494 domain-containing protein [Chryseobacterium sp.]|nr:DUF3494 domain-containing protein [Chryseobacterium sp.]
MNKFLLLLATFAIICFSPLTYGQISLGTAANFALFTTTGAVTNVGTSQITGDVGSNNGAVTNFGNVDGVMHNADGATASAAADLTIAANLINATPNTGALAPLLGNGQTITPGVYSIGSAATMTGILTLDGAGNTNPLFIIKVQGGLSAAANTQVNLTNGAVACNIFWKVEGLVDLAANTIMRGNVIANNAAIVLQTGVTIEGRALSTTGAITVTNGSVRKPLGCGVPQLTGPAAPTLNTVACYTIFSGNGAVTNTGTTFVTGDVGTNVGLTTGFQASNVTGTIHPSPDTSTAQAAVDLAGVYTYLNGLPHDIQLLFPATFGNGLILTPHTYLLNAATVHTGTVFLDAQNNANAVFVIKIVGALSTGTAANVVLLNSAQAKNVFWLVDGATNLGTNAILKGTLIGNNGAIIVNTGASIEGRVLSTSGGISTFAINAQMTPGCTNLGTESSVLITKSAQLYPNPFSSVLNVNIEGLGSGANLTIYSAIGTKVLSKVLSTKTTELQMNLPVGVYYYQLTGKNGVQQGGKLISK